MKCTLLICVALALLLSQSQALPSYMARFASRRADDGHDFRAPTDSDVRSPCPMLNTLANHGYLPRSGKNITSAMLGKAFVDQLGTSSFFGNAFAKLAFSKFSKGGPMIDLSATWLPVESGGIEHVASLTRGDHTPQSKPDKARLEKELALIKKTKDDDLITVKDLADIRKSLEADSKAEIAKTPKATLIGAAEACLLHGVASGKSNGVKVAWFRSILEEEKFPADWVKSSHILNTGYGLTNLIPCLMGLEWDKKWSKADLAGIPYTEGAKNETKSFF